MNEQTIALVAAFNSHNEVLLLRRHPDAHCGDLWSFPGGKIEAGEMPLEAARRELKEETGLSGKFWSLLGTTMYAYHDRTLHFQFFACDCSDISALHAESEHQWVGMDDISDFPMPDANAALLPMLSRRGSVTDYLTGNPAGTG